MKKISGYVLLFPILAFCAGFMPGDDCTAYAPSKEGMELEYRNYNPKNKPEGGSKTKIISVKNESGATVYEALAEAFDKKNKPIGSTTYTMKCENGQFYVDMQSLVSSQQKEAFGEMNVDVQADKLDIPSSPEPGQQLKDGNLKMTGSTEGSAIRFNLAIKITNRKVDAVEEITVPAGTFKAVKITYDTEAKMIVTVRSRVAEWYVKDIGVVRSESYDKNGKLQSYMVLHSIK